MMRKIARRAVPPPPPPTGLQQQLALLLRVELVPLQLFWLNLRALRSWWPILLPLLLVYAVRTYRRERHGVLVTRRAQAAPK
ncbi:MAG: hypothetical protein RLZZ387_46 [Chloroflexota bacterium]|jgi:hypothetical protein